MSELIYLLAAVLFILSIRGLSAPRSARLGNFLGIAGMTLAIVAALTLISPERLLPVVLALAAGGVIGVVSGQKVRMTALPQMIAAFNGLGGLAAVFLAAGEAAADGTHYFASSVGLVIGALAFSGSMVAFAKLEGLLPGKALLFPFQHPLNLLLSLITVILFFGFAFTHAEWMFWLLAAVSLLLGLLLVLPVGGADMPIVISVLNSYSGWAAVGIGFMLSQTLMIITGTIVGASGAILAFVMTKAMNSSLVQVMLGGAAKNRQNAETGGGEKGVARSGSPEDAAFIMENAEKIIIVPGYGMAAARAQHALKEMAGLLRRKYDVQVRFAIHPVAGRMPGHMNVLLAEADVPYDEIFEMDDINRDFADADVAYVIGANDITNPLAKTDPSSPIYGMPVLDVAAAKTVFFVKRSLSSGYSGVDNPLFYNENTIMLYGDAKAVTEAVVKQLEK